MDDPRHSVVTVDALAGHGPERNPRFSPGLGLNVHAKVCPQVGQLGVGPSFYVLAGPKWLHGRPSP